jgi:hypothetical protein
MKTMFKPIVVFALLVSIESSMFAQHFFSHQGNQRFRLLYDEEEEAEDSIRGLTYGLNLGVYFGNAETSNLYNGSGNFDGFINEAAEIQWFSVEERIGVNSPFLNDVRDIRTFYNTESYTFPFDSYPTNMRYNPAMYVGLQLKYNFNRFAALVFNLNALRLKAIGQFSIQFIGTPLQINAQNDVRLFSIIGEEQRFNINLGYRQGWMMGDYSNFYIQLGGSMLGTKWTQNYVIVAERSFDLVTNIPTIGQSPMQAQQAARVGFGAYTSAGVEFWLGKYSFDLSFGMSRDQVKLLGFEKALWNRWLQLSFML